MKFSDMTNKQLIAELIDAASRAGVSHSGLVITATASIDRQRVIALKQEVLRRLDDNSQARAVQGQE
jgi:hypothetical protein